MVGGGYSMWKLNDAVTGEELVGWNQSLGMLDAAARDKNLEIVGRGEETSNS